MSYTINKPNRTVYQVQDTNTTNVVQIALGKDRLNYSYSAINNMAHALKSAGVVTLPNGCVITADTTKQLKSKPSKKLPIAHPIVIGVYLYGAYTLLKIFLEW